MSISSSKSEIAKELERAKQVIERLWEVVSNLDNLLEPIERELAIKDFDPDGDFAKTAAKGFILVPHSGEDDPIIKVLEWTKESEKKTPSIIRINEMNEDTDTVWKTVSMFESEVMKQENREHLIINLRWSKMPEPLEAKKTVVIGKRYILGKEEDISYIQERLTQLGLYVVDDTGEFGGGPVVYEFVRLLGNKSSSVVMELTISESVIKDKVLVSQILELISTI
ncbi:MAG: hypothetical protein ACXABC_12960 [Candidatus Thorarchaeota archaeon]